MQFFLIWLFVFEHHVNDIHQSAFEATESLRFGFAFGYFSLEIFLGVFVPRSGNLGQSDAVDGGVELAIAGFGFDVAERFAG